MMKIIKRNGQSESVQFDKILSRIKSQMKGLDQNWVDPSKVAMKTIEGLFDGVQSRQLDILAAEISASMAGKHPDYAKLAARIAITNLYKDTPDTFSRYLELLWNHINPQTGLSDPQCSKLFYESALQNLEKIEEIIDHKRDLLYNYFGYKTLEKSYLIKQKNLIVERPQYLYMRIAIGLHDGDFEKVKETYDLLSLHQYTHATPTMFNAGSQRSQLASCFLLNSEDSIDGIYESLKDCAKLSKYAGGIGINVSGWRSSGSYISGTNGNSNGIIPFIRVFNNSSTAVDQCFIKGTLIETYNGYKSIEELQEGELVKTADNLYNKINKVKKYLKEYENIISITTDTGQIKVTPDHQILVLINIDKLLSKDIIINNIKNNIFVPQWISAKDLNNTDLILKY
jgi:hypothetical protein